MNRVRTTPAPPAIAPEESNTSDIEALRATLHQVVQTLANIQQGRESVNMDALAPSFTDKAGEWGYESRISISTSLVGVNCERVVACLACAEPRTSCWHYTSRQQIVNRRNFISQK